MKIMNIHDLNEWKFIQSYIFDVILRDKEKIDFQTKSKNRTV